MVRSFIASCFLPKVMSSMVRIEGQGCTPGNIVSSSQSSISEASPPSPDLSNARLEDAPRAKILLYVGSCTKVLATKPPRLDLVPTLGVRALEPSKD